MTIELIKIFSFSACHTVSDKVLGQNYRLGIIVEWVERDQEERLIEIVHREIISKVHTRDLNQHVDFLKNTKINDATLLQAFQNRLSGPLSNFIVKRLFLERDSETSATLFPDVI